MANFEKQMQNLEANLDGIVGLKACHLPSKQMLSYNADRLFLLCSTYKIAIAVCLLQKVERNEFSLDQNIEIHDYDLRPGMASNLNQLNYSNPVTLSIHNILQFMLQESCNSSSDLIINLIGGPTVVMHTLQQANIDHLFIKRSCIESVAIWDGVYNRLPKDYRITLEQYAKLESQVSAADIEKAHKNFDITQDNHGSPAAMCELLRQIACYQIINQTHAELLLKTMRRCRTGANRILGLLPLEHPYHIKQVL